MTTQILKCQNQTGLNPWQVQYPVTYPQGVPAVLVPQEAVPLVTQRAREALNDQRETARRAHQQGEPIDATHQYEAAARQTLVNSLARNNEAHNCNVQVQVRHLEHEADARLSQRPREFLSLLSQAANQALARKSGNGSFIRSMEARRASVFDLHTALSLEAQHAEDVKQQKKREYVGLHQHLTGLVQETQQYRGMFEPSRAAQSASGPDFDRLRRREEELSQEVRHQNDARAKFEAQSSRKRTDWSPINSGHHKAGCESASYALKLCHCKHLQAAAVPPAPTAHLAFQPEVTSHLGQRSTLLEDLSVHFRDVTEWCVYVRA